MGLTVQCLGVSGYSLVMSDDWGMYLSDFQVNPDEGIGSCSSFAMETKTYTFLSSFEKQCAPTDEFSPISVAEELFANVK